MQPTNRKIYRDASLSSGSEHEETKWSNSEVGGLRSILIFWFMSQCRADILCCLCKLGLGDNNVQEFVADGDAKHIEGTDGSVQQDF